MSTHIRMGLALSLSAAIVLAGAGPSFAQRRGSFNFGGNGGSNNGGNNNNNSNNGGNNNSNNNNSNNNNRNKKDDDDNNNGNKNKNSTGAAIQQMIQGGGNNGGNKNGNNGQNNNNGNQFPSQFQKNGQNGNNNNNGNGQNNNNKNPLGQVMQNGQGQNGGNGNWQNGNKWQNGQGWQNNGNNWQKQKFNHQNDLQNWVVGFNGGPKPFSNDWYQNHPQAWKHNHNNNDGWQIATAAGVVGFLGWQSVHPYHDNVVYVYDQVPYDTIVVNQPNVVYTANDWMPLGVYTLMMNPGDNGTRMLDLSVNKAGQLRGSYYDMITNASYQVGGVIDQNSQQARWTLDSNRQLTFAAMLDQLTQPQGIVSVKLPSGQIQEWQLVRMQNATASN